MATEPPAQRAYRSACPNCGAPVEFRSAASAFAVCSFCKSTIVRDGDALRRIGQSAELFDDHSPLQLGASGRYQGAAFTLVGRIQYRYAEGTWNEWHALFDGADGAHRSGWLSEDNGRYVFAFDAELREAAPSPTALRAGAALTLAGQAWSVASASVAKVLAVQGELPAPPNLTGGFVVYDLRNTQGEVGTLDYSDPRGTRWSIGRSVALSELAMTGLAEASEKTLSARGTECPSCGAALEVRLTTTQSIVCGQCHAVVDVSAGVGGEMAHYAQTNPSEPQIPLGTTGTLALTRAGALPWQVVGYVERCEVDTDPGEAQSFWREYLLYHRVEGFAFLVDAQDGWSWTAPITGVPQVAGDGVTLDGARFRKLYDYTGMVTYVLGEFYWQVTQNQRTANTDYQGTGAASALRLNREQTVGDQTQEVVWSAGQTLSAEAVQQAFRLAPAQAAALGRDALPTTFQANHAWVRIAIWVFIIIVLIVLIRGCVSDTGACDDVRAAFGASSPEYQNCMRNLRSGAALRTGGAAFGGISSGGAHK